MPTNNAKDFNVKVLIVLLILLVVSGTARGATGIQIAGDVLQVVVPATAFSITAIQKDPRGAGQLLKSYALSSGTTLLLKGVVNEHRPDGGEHSFPSGHSCNVFTSAEFMRMRYGLKWGLPFYGVASFVAYSRVESRQHHIQDVFAGASIGILSAHLFSRPHQNWNASIGLERKAFALSFHCVW